MRTSTKASSQYQTFHTKLLCLISIFLLSFTSLYAQDLSAQREAFNEAVKLAQSGKSQALTHERSLLKNYILRSDIKAIYLKKTLKSQSKKTIESFLTTYPDQSTSNDLLRAWLDHLYKSGQWDSYLALAPAPKPVRGSVKRRCQYIEAQVRARHSVDLTQDALPVWMVGKSQPDECDGLFAIMKDRGLLNKDRIHARIDLTLEKAKFQLATHLSSFLPTNERKEIVSKQLCGVKCRLIQGKY